MDNKSEDSAKENAETLATISANCNKVLYFLQTVMVKSPHIIAVPLFICSEIFAHVWFH